MLTLDKIKEYESLRGFYDGFFMQKISTNTNINSNKDWSLIAHICQDYRIVLNNQAAKDFADRLYSKLEQHCENKEAIEYLSVVALKGY